jgi:hypothetical protein
MNGYMHVHMGLCIGVKYVMLSVNVRDALTIALLK